jgi:hypothetical protein
VYKDLTLLPGRLHGVFNFMDTDTSTLRKHNERKMGAKWKYHSKTLTYTNNSNGYRAPEWDQVDWSNSVIALGCSYIYGIGHSDEDTIVKCIERKLGRPVVNLGVGGTGLIFHIENTNRLLAAGIKPKAVVLLHPPTSRFTYFFKDGLQNIGPWVNKTLLQDMWKQYAYDDHHVVTMQHMYSNAISNMWNCPVVKYSFEWEDRNAATNFSITDRASDNLHPGDKTFDRLSNAMVKDLRKVI